MEKSIESIWKEGFLKSDALVAPKLNNLYTQKSKHIIDKFNRMFKINLIALVAFSIFVLIASFIMGIPYMGISVFILLNVIVIINKKLLDSLQEIDKGVSSYEYLTAFNSWMKKQVSINKRMSTFIYPILFLSVVIGIWVSNDFQDFFTAIMARPNEIYLMNGIPVFWLLGVILVTCIFALIGGRIYKWDVNLMYGSLFKKLDEIVADIEELRA